MPCSIESSAAKALGIPTGGYMPLGFLIEDGPRPEFRDLYGAEECPAADYAARTRWNVIDASATLWFGTIDSPGYRTTEAACQAQGRPMKLVRDGVTRPSDVVAWLRMTGFRSLNIAGNRESSNPGIGERTERFMLAVFRATGQDSPGAGRARGHRNPDQADPLLNR